MSRSHAMDSAACWCNPELFVPCTECTPEQYTGAQMAGLTKMPTDEGCWACVHGLRRITRDEAAKTTQCVVAVHW